MGSILSHKLIWLMLTFLIMGCSTNDATQPDGIIAVTTIGRSINYQGVVFTVLGVEDNGHKPSGSNDQPVKRLITIRVRVKNVNHSSLVISPDKFSIVSTDGNRDTAIGVIFEEQPPVWREIKKGQQIFAWVQFSSEQKIGDLAMLYTPNQEAEPIQVNLIPWYNISGLSFTSSDLTPLLFQDGDLPEIYQGAETKGELPNADLLVGFGLDKPDEFAARFIQTKSGEISGSVSVFAYDLLDVIDGIFTAFENNGWPLVSDIGERAIYQEIQPTDMDHLSKLQYINFVRCHTFVIIMFTTSDTDDQITFDELKSFAQNLDGRLLPVVCK